MPASDQLSKDCPGSLYEFLEGCLRLHGLRAGVENELVGSNVSPPMLMWRTVVQSLLGHAEVAMPERRWIRLGAVAGIGFVLVSLVAAALTGVPPQPDGKATTYQNFWIA